jgi:prepilin-type N-terminal cleavage/methylation domain-containing protein
MTGVRPDGRGCQRGFSLLEVLIALVIAGIALATVFQAAAETIRSSTTTAHYQQAVSRARSHIDGIGANLVAGDQEGDDGGGFRWHTLVRVVDSTGKQDTTGKPVPNTDSLIITLYAVTVWIVWRDGPHERMVRLDSQRLLTSAPG